MHVKHADELKNITSTQTATGGARPRAGRLNGNPPSGRTTITSTIYPGTDEGGVVARFSRGVRLLCHPLFSALALVWKGVHLFTGCGWGYVRRAAADRHFFSKRRAARASLVSHERFVHAIVPVNVPSNVLPPPTIPRSDLALHRRPNLARSLAPPHRL